MASKFGTSSLMLVGGSVLGAGLALLFAPYSGAKSRKKLARMSKNVSKMSERMAHNVNDSMSDFADSMGSMGKRASNMFHRW